MIPVMLFRQQPEVLEKWQRRIRYLLVDEYQDTNLAQYELVKTLVNEKQALTVVGDDDQSIYAWRGARPENLMQLQEDFPALNIIKLEQNYRSTGRILKAANTLIDNNPHLISKALWSELGPAILCVLSAVKMKKPSANGWLMKLLICALKDAVNTVICSTLSRQLPGQNGGNQVAGPEYSLRDNRRAVVLCQDRNQGHYGLSSAGN